MTLPQLIERLEKATGPERELDLAIAQAIRKAIIPDSLRGLEGRYGDFAFIDSSAHETGYCLSRLRQYTGSTETAALLVPKGWTWRVGNLPSGIGFADLGTQKSLQCVEGATPAIALCIASLKARHLSLSGEA